MKRALPIVVLCLGLCLFGAGPSQESPLWQTWEDTPMVREWKELVAREAWKNNTIGIDHEVPPPWIAMTARDASVEMWGRAWEFGGKALPQQITSQGERLLSSPFRFVALVDGKWTSSDVGKGRVVSFFPDQVVYEGETSVSGVSIKTRFTLEFDGFVWMEFHISASNKVERLALEIPVRREVAQFYRKQSEGLTEKAVRDRWGKITVNRQLGPLKSYFAKDFCFANDRVGIDFSSEGVRGWYAKSFRRRVEWLVDNQQVVARFNFVDDPPGGGFPDTKVEFGCNVMPYRPLERRNMANFIYSWEAQGAMYKEIMGSPSPCVHMVSPYFRGLDEMAARKHVSDACAPSCLPMPRNPERFLNYMKRLRKEKPGIKIVYYQVGDLHTDYDPVFIQQAAKWKGADDKLDEETVYAELRKARGRIRRVCGWNRDFMDYKVFYLTYWADKLGLDGYYWDDQNYMPCVNPEHKEHFYTDCNGKRLEWKPIRPYREMVKRAYKAIKKKNPDAFFFGHTFPPHAPFSEMSIDGEVLRKLSGDKRYYTRFVEPEDCRNVFFNSHVDGSAKALLPEYSGRFYTGKEAPQATRALLAFLWMTDMNVWIGQCDDMTLMHGFIHPRGAFGCHDAEYLGYWNQEIAEVEADNVFCTIYRKNDRALLIVSNLGREPFSGMVNLDLSKLLERQSTGFLYTLKACNAETRQPLSLKLVPAQAACLAEIPVSIPAEDFCLIEIK